NSPRRHLCARLPSADRTRADATGSRQEWHDQALMAVPSPDGESGRCEVALVSMPWAPPLEPSLGLGILKKCLGRAGHTARIFHLGPEFLRWLTPQTYQYLADGWGLNDFLFTGELDPGLSDRQMAVVHERVWHHHRSRPCLPSYPTPDSALDLFLRVRN